MPGSHRLESEGKKEQICHHWEGYETHTALLDFKCPFKRVCFFLVARFSHTRYTPEQVFMWIIHACVWFWLFHRLIDCWIYCWFSNPSNPHWRWKCARRLNWMQDLHVSCFQLWCCSVGSVWTVVDPHTGPSKLSYNHLTERSLSLQPGLVNSKIILLSL